jgi:hypothetical protein
MDVLQRTNWHGTPVQLGDVFTLRKGDADAHCALQTHEFGWELRLMVGTAAELWMSRVCRTQDDVLTTGEQWKAAMIEKGWV